MNVQILYAQAGTAADAGSQFIKNGLLGATCVILAGVIVFLFLRYENKSKALQEAVERLQEQRVTDAQNVTTQLLKTNAECVTALTTVSSAMEAQRKAMGELRQAFRSLADEVRARALRQGR